MHSPCVDTRTRSLLQPEACTTKFLVYHIAADALLVKVPVSRAWQPPIPNSDPVRSVRLRRVVRDTWGLQRHDMWTARLPVLTGSMSQE